VDSRDLLAASDLPAHEAERLLLSVTGRTRAELYLDPLSEADVVQFRTLAEQRMRGVPLQYLEGTVQFGSVELHVDTRALIPRPETEHLWEEAAAALGNAGPGTRIVDLCTGSGALALALKERFPAAQVFGSDVSEQAIALAQENASLNDLEVGWCKGDLFDALPTRLKGRVDLVVSNPPYVSAKEYDGLPEEIRLHEPEQALVAGPMGDEVLERIAGEVYWWLGTGGWLFCEIGETQGERALEMFGGWLSCEVRNDLTGRPRILVGRKGARCC
jgi:release factor glutamine methyltransferase